MDRPSRADFAALANGPSTIAGLSDGLDNVATQQAFEQMGVRVERGKQRTVVHGVGLRGLSMPNDVIDCGNSGTTMRLLSGLLSAQPFGSTLVGDASLHRRPMSRVIEPLRARGAHIAGTSGMAQDKLYPPIRIAPLLENEALSGLQYDMPIASAQVKSALLLSGLYAKGPTFINEPFVSRDHTERMMLALGVPIETIGSAVTLDPTQDWAHGWAGFEWDVPGDPSSAAFPLIAATLLAGSEVTVEHVTTNPTRTGLFDALRLRGAPLDIQPAGDAAGGEPVASITARHHAVAAQTLGGELLVRMIDEVPVFAALATMTNGVTLITDAEELRVKESDRIAVMVDTLQKFGVRCEERQDGMLIDGPSTLIGAHIDSRGDHRIAMSATVLGLLAEGDTIIDNVDCVDTSFPGFVKLFQSLGANIEEFE
ncbi:MAG: 3-phosphoshikimate 1-carboxyvinyltransferase [Polyangiales bacterium]